MGAQEVADSIGERCKHDQGHFPVPGVFAQAALEEELQGQQMGAVKSRC